MLRPALSALLCFLLFTGASALAQGEEDAGIDVPDASVGEGGADRDNEEQEDSTGRVVEVCLSGGDCSKGFRCEQGRCRYSGTRRVEGGCLLGVQAALFLGGVAVMTRRARVRRRGADHDKRGSC